MRIIPFKYVNGHKFVRAIEGLREFTFGEYFYPEDFKDISRDSDGSVFLHIFKFSRMHQKTSFRGRQTRNIHNNVPIISANVFKSAFNYEGYEYMIMCTGGLPRLITKFMSDTAITIFGKENLYDD